MKSKNNFDIECGRQTSNISDEESFLLDVVSILKDIYTATFSIDGEKLEVSFSNGQKIKLFVEKVK